MNFFLTAAHVFFPGTHAVKGFTFRGEDNTSWKSHESDGKVAWESEIQGCGKCLYVFVCLWGVVMMIQGVPNWKGSQNIWITLKLHALYLQHLGVLGP